MISVRFLGTGGARFVVARQIRASGGMWMRFGETQIHVDPGPGALVRALSVVPPCEPAQLDAIVLSHKHLDHANDVNVMAEAMSQGGWKKRGTIFAPRDAFEGDAVVFPYVRSYVGGCEYLEERGGPYVVGDVAFETSIRHRHGVETYGLHFRYGGASLSYLPCGRLFPELIDDYAAHKPDVLVLNVLRFRDTMDVDHLTFDDARAVLAGVRPKTAILSHFGTKMLERDPNRLARDLEDELGLRVYAAHDGWTYEHEYA
jgi:phosphoribosyl 1,2-cyclic phosphodiesterase